MIKPKVALLIGIIALVVVLASSQLHLLSLTSSGFALIPIGARMECSSDQTPTYYPDENIGTKVPTTGQGIWFRGNAESNVVRFKGTSVNALCKNYNLDLAYQFCSDTPGDCTGVQHLFTPSGGDWSTDFATLLVNSAKRNVWVTCSDCFGIKVQDCYVRQEFYQFRLVDFCGGSKNIISNDCKIPYSVSWSDKLLQKDGAVPDELSRGSWRNYVCNWAVGPTKLYDYNGGKVICDINSRHIYSPQTLLVVNGEVKAVDPTNTNALPDATLITGFGADKGIIECCPIEPNCCDNFKWCANTNKECTSNVDCTNLGNPIPVNSIQYKTHTCDLTTWKCVWNGPFNAQCTADSACPSGKICDLTLSNYGRCIDVPNGPYCGDKKCDAAESTQTCPADCIQPPIVIDWNIVLIIVAIAAGLFIGYQIGIFKKLGRWLK